MVRSRGERHMELGARVAQRQSLVDRHIVGAPDGGLVLGLEAEGDLAGEAAELKFFQVFQIPNRLRELFVLIVGGQMLCMYT